MYFPGALQQWKTLHLEEIVGLTEERQKMSDIPKNCVDNVPIIDLSNAVESEIIEQISKACQTYGFFQVINHGIFDENRNDLRSAMEDFFIRLSQPQKDALRRSEKNSRGYFDDELTKQKRDWKECLDVGMPGSRDWNVVPDSHPQNSCLEGFNQFPSEDVLPCFRSKVIQYFQACEDLSHKIATYMSLGLGLSHEGVDQTNDVHEATQLIDSLRKDHTSFLRLNYYPPCADKNCSGIEGDGDSIMGISPHTDAGFLTILLQDDGCHSLQVALQRQLVDNVGSSLEWMTVHPIPGALTVNTGDMCTIWSNGLYKAPLHRVLTNTEKSRFSAPFFYNPPYRAVITPLPSLLQPQEQDNNHERNQNGALYTHPCAWGYFRAIRFAGDLTDFGTEIQISDYAIGSTSEHPIRQEKFMKEVDFNQPFSVLKYWFHQSKRNDEEAATAASGRKPHLSINTSEGLKVADDSIVQSEGQDSSRHEILKGVATYSNSSDIVTEKEESAATELISPLTALSLKTAPSVTKIWVKVQLDVPADKTGLRPHQAFVSFNKNSGAGNLESPNSSIEKTKAAASPIPEAHDAVFIVKIQVAAGGVEQKSPMLLYNCDRSIKTFIHFDGEDPEVFKTLQHQIVSKGMEGALGKSGGLKGYFFAKFEDASRVTTKYISVNCANMAPDQAW